MASLSTYDIARKIQRLGEPLRTAVDRVHHWVRAGAIKPIGRAHPGTGKRRRYPLDTAARVALLQAIADHGVPARVAILWLRDPEILAPFFENASEPADRTLLVISETFDGREWRAVGMRTPDDLANWVATSNFDNHVVIHAGKIRDRLIAKTEGKKK